MQGQGQEGLYYRALDRVARFVQGEGVSAQVRASALLAMCGLLLGLAWTAANLLVAQVGELPGTPAYDRLLYSYLMRLLCGESLVIGAILLSTAWAQQAGRIPTYPIPDEDD